MDIFWQNFWPNFWADLIVGVFITSIIGWLYQRTHVLKLKLAAKIIYLNIRQPQPQIKVRFSIHNVGNRALLGNDAYYTILVNTRLQPSILSYGTQYPPHCENVKAYSMNYMRFDAMITGPALPNMKSEIFELQVNTNKFQPSDFLFWFSTVDGFIPKPPLLKRLLLKKGSVIPGMPEFYDD